MERSGLVPGQGEAGQPPGSGRGDLQQGQLVIRVMVMVRVIKICQGHTQVLVQGQGQGCCIRPCQSYGQGHNGVMVKL